MVINGYALKVLRERSGLSQRMLGAAAGLSHAAVSLLEQGGVKPCKPSTALQLAQALKIPILALVPEVELDEHDKALLGVVTPPASCSVCRSSFQVILGPHPSFVNGDGEDVSMCMTCRRERAAVS